MNHTIIYPDCILFWGTNQRSITHHQHPAVQLVMGIEQPFLTKNNQGQWINCPNILVAPNYPHQCDAAGIEILSLIVDQESLLGEHILRTMLLHQPWHTYANEVISQLNLPQLLTDIQQQHWEQIYGQITRFFGAQTLAGLRSSHQDERVITVLNYLKAHFQENITTQILTEIACLSESRLLHLFKNQVGLPIRNYILWLKIKAAIALIIRQQYNLTQIAYEAGFADSAHMTRTFNKVLGISPSMITKNSKFVQVSLPDVF